MSVFFRAARAGSTPVVGTLQELLAGRRLGGRTAAPVTFDSSLAIPAVLDAVRLRANLVSSLPVQTYRERDGVSVPVTNPPVLTMPGGEGVDIGEFLFSSQVSLDLRGNAFGLVVAWDGLGLPRQIELQHPDEVAVRRVEGRLRYRIGGKEYEATSVWHERQFTIPGSPLGLSPIAYAATALGINLAAEQFGSDWFRDGAHPTHVLTNKEAAEITEGAAKTVKARVKAATTGTREPLVLAGGWDLKPLQVAPAESQFLETMKFGVNQVARIFDVEPEMIGGSSEGSSITYANVEQRAIGNLTYRLGPVITRRERALTRLTPAPRFVKLNRGALLATDLLTRYRSYETGIRSGFLTRDEARALEDREPLTEEQLAQIQQVPSPAPPTPVAVVQEA